MNLRTLAVISFLTGMNVVTPVLNASDEAFSFPVRDGHCVAWRARKTMFLVQDLRPSGVNCKVSSRIVVVPEGEYAEIRVPVMEFDSGSKMRDKDVALMLGAGGNPEIVVKTEIMPKGALQEMWNASGGTLKSRMVIAGRPAPVDVGFKVVKEGDVPLARGFLKTTFAFHGLTAPSVAAGLVTKVDEEIELHYQLRRDRFLQ